MSYYLNSWKGGIYRGTPIGVSDYSLYEGSHRLTVPAFF